MDNGNMENGKGPLVSVCVPTYNGETYLKDCFDGIVSQTLEDFEVVVVDDNSTDQSFEIALEYAKQDRRFRVYRNSERLGLVGNWNRSLQLSHGKWIKFLFQDDAITINCLERLVNSCEKEQKKFGFCEREFIFDENVDLDLRKYFLGHQEMIQELYRDHDYIDPDAFAQICAKQPKENVVGEPTVTLFHRSVFEEYGTFNATLIQICDLEYWARIGTNVGIVYVPEKLATFRVHGRSTTSHNLTSRAYRTKMLDRLVLYYLFLRQPEFRRMRKALYRRLGRNIAWWYCVGDAYRAWRKAWPWFKTSDEALKLRNEWKDVVKVYPRLQLLALVGMCLMPLRSSISMLGLERFVKKSTGGRTTTAATAATAK